MDQSRWRHPRWARREISELDPFVDARRISQLLFEARYGSPLLVRPLFSLAFARQVAVPAIAETLHRGGRGLILSDTARRNDDTLVFFGLLFRHLGTPRADRVLERIERMHARYHIPNDLHLYTLATLACLPERAARRLGVEELLSPRESVALHAYWSEVGRRMGIDGIPSTSDAMLAWMLDFEASEYAPSRAGREVTAALGREVATRLLPPALGAWGERLFYALFDERLREVHGISAPRPMDAVLVRAALRGFVIGTRWLPDGEERSLVDRYGHEYGADPAPERVGPDAIAATA